MTAIQQWLMPANNIGAVLGVNLALYQFYNDPVQNPIFTLPEGAAEGAEWMNTTEESGLIVIDTQFTSVFIGDIAEVMQGFRFGCRPEHNSSTPDGTDSTVEYTLSRTGYDDITLRIRCVQGDAPTFLKEFQILVGGVDVTGGLIEWDTDPIVSTLPTLVVARNTLRFLVDGVEFAQYVSPSTLMPYPAQIGFQLTEDSEPGITLVAGFIQIDAI